MVCKPLLIFHTFNIYSISIKHMRFWVTRKREDYMISMEKRDLSITVNRTSTTPLTCKCILVIFITFHNILYLPIDLETLATLEEPPLHNKCNKTRDLMLKLSWRSPLRICIWVALLRYDSHLFVLLFFLLFLSFYKKVQCWKQFDISGI